MSTTSAIFLYAAAFLGGFVLLWWYGAYRGRRRRAKHLMLLAESRCPRCSGIYGIRAAQSAARAFDAPQGPPLFSREWWGRGSVYYGSWWEAHCPDCGVARFFDPYEGKVLLGTGDRTAAIAAGIISAPSHGPDWGASACTNCGAHKRHWADHAHWRCARCHEPLGQPPALPAIEETPLR